MRMFSFSAYQSLAEHGEWTRETQAKVERIGLDDDHLASIYYLARTLIGRFDRAEIEEIAAGYYGSNDAPPPIIRPAITEAAIIVARDSAFIRLEKVRQDYCFQRGSEDERRVFGGITSGTERDQGVSPHFYNEAHAFWDEVRDDVLVSAEGEERWRLAGIFNLNKLARRFEAMVRRANSRNYQDAA